VDVCRTKRAPKGKGYRINGLARRGYCSALQRYFFGVREHLVFTEKGFINYVVQISGNRHDVQGLYALLKTPFKGHLLGDNAYWPRHDQDPKLLKRGIVMTAQTRKGFSFEYESIFKQELHRTRSYVERRIAIFNKQFHADRTLNRSKPHYVARRWCKVAAHNLSRHLNKLFGTPPESCAHFRAVA